MSEPTCDLGGKHVLVTGATGGLGSALAVMSNTMREGPKRPAF